MYHEPIECPRRPRRDDKFKLECVIVCSQYDDFLRNTLPNNKFIFDRLVVVTSPEDKRTQKLCEFYHVECVKSERLTRNGKFHKGMAVNDGLDRLSKDAWVLHLDADIWLPPQTRFMLERAELDPRMLYGIDRFNVKGIDQWQDFLNHPPLQHEAGAYIHLSNHRLSVGTRVMQNHMQGWLPIGFFQLWNPKHSGISKYPEGHTDAGREDLLFANQWCRACRALIPEIIGYHLESDDAGFGTNWAGRKTARFERNYLTFWEKLVQFWRSLNLGGR